MFAVGLLVGALEGCSIVDSIYLAFGTGLTIGYGDFAPTMRATRNPAMGIGVCGAICTALLAAVAVGALAAAFLDIFPPPRADT